MMRPGDATRRGRTSGRRGRRKRSERGPSFVERGRGAARRSAEQSARICRDSFFSLRGRVRYKTPLIFVSRQAFGLDEC
jgi:hypothetical protein